MKTTPKTFENIVRKRFSEYFRVELKVDEHPKVKKKFDMISKDLQYIGDAKFYTLVKGTKIPPAKFSIIAEYVWLLEKTGAPHTFLVFGNDKRVPEGWLRRYGNLLLNTEFYFLHDDDTIERLYPPVGKIR